MLILFNLPDLSVAPSENLWLVHTFCQSRRGLVLTRSLCPEKEFEVLAADGEVVPEASDFRVIDVLMAETQSRNPQSL